MKDPTSERRDVLETLSEAVGLLTRSLDARLIPPHGVRMGYAIRGARDNNGIAAVSGGIVAGNGKPCPAGPCGFGADEDIGRIILTVMRFDPDIRSAATLRNSRNIPKVMESLLLDCTTFDTANGPPGISTMDWSVASCCREGVPDVCFPRGNEGKGSDIILFGEDPIDVTNNIIMISNRIISMEL